MTTNISPSFSRSGRSGSSGKNTERVGADVPESLLCALNDAVELFREHTPTATRAEVVREIIENDLHGCIASLTRAFPSAKNMDLEAAEKTLATLAGQSVEQFRRSVMTKHIFGRLQAVEDIVGDAPDLGQPLNAAGIGTVSDLNGSAQR